MMQVLILPSCWGWWVSKFITDVGFEHLLTWWYDITQFLYVFLEKKRRDMWNPHFMTHFWVFPWKLVSTGLYWCPTPITTWLGSFFSVFQLLKAHKVFFFTNCSLSPWLITMKLNQTDVYASHLISVITRWQLKQSLSHKICSCCCVTQCLIFIFGFLAYFISI